MLFVAYLVLLYVSPKSPPWNASKSTRIFENDFAGRDVNSCSSGSRFRSGFRLGPGEVSLGERGVVECVEKRRHVFWSL
jgi:hypothetical protein